MSEHSSDHSGSHAQEKTLSRPGIEMDVEPVALGCEPHEFANKIGPILHIDIIGALLPPVLIDV